MNRKRTPTEPTPEMIEAFKDAWFGDFCIDAQVFGCHGEPQELIDQAVPEALKAALSAAPDPLEDAELVERVARAICVSYGQDPNALTGHPIPGPELAFEPCLVWERQIDTARAVIAAMKGE